MSKKSLYYFDSSDDEDEAINAKYTFENISNTLVKIKSYLASSYILTEVSQSILEQQNIQKKYAELKNSVGKIVKVPENVSFYNKANKFLGKFLIEDGFLSKIDLDQEAKDFIKNLLLTGEEAKRYLYKKDFFAKDVSEIFKENTNFKIDSDQIRLENRCLKVCSDL